MPVGRTVIASRTLLAIDGKGQEFEIAIAVGEPYHGAESEWACPVSMEGLYEHLSDQHGVDSWQALQLAHQLIAQLLVYFVRDGGRLFDPENREPVMPEELFPRLALRD